MRRNPVSRCAMVPGMEYSSFRRIVSAPQVGVAYDPVPSVVNVISPDCHLARLTACGLTAAEDRPLQVPCGPLHSDSRTFSPVTLHTSAGALRPIAEEV